MNPEIWADDSGFLGSPRSAPVTARFGGAGAAQPRHAYQIHVYRATVRLLPAAAGGVCTANVVSETHRRVLLIGVCLSGIDCAQPK
jgi:hypothetical protein